MIVVNDSLRLVRHAVFTVTLLYDLLSMGQFHFLNIVCNERVSTVTFKLLRIARCSLFFVTSGPVTPQDRRTLVKGIELIITLSLKKFLMKC